MWKDATILGLGVCKMPTGAYLVVGRYSGEPGTVLGNMAGRFPDNVLPLRGSNYKSKVNAILDMHENSYIECPIFLSKISFITFLHDRIYIK